MNGQETGNLLIFQRRKETFRVQRVCSDKPKGVADAMHLLSARAEGSPRACLHVRSNITQDGKELLVAAV